MRPGPGFHVLYAFSAQVIFTIRIFDTTHSTIFCDFRISDHAESEGGQTDEDETEVSSSEEEDSEASHWELSVQGNYAGHWTNCFQGIWKWLL